MALDFCQNAEQLCSLFTTVQNIVQNASVDDLPTKAKDLKKIDEMIKTECIGSKIGDVLRFVTLLDEKFETKFGLQEIKYLDLFRDNNFLKHVLDHVVRDVDSTAINHALYKPLPKTPGRVWHCERLSIFACNCQQFSIKDSLHVHCVYLPAAVNHQIPLDVTNVFAIDFDSLLLQTQAMGWLDLSYCIEPKMSFKLDVSSDPILQHLTAAMTLTANLIGTLLCSPCCMDKHLVSVWTTICENIKAYSAEVSNGRTIKETQLYKSILISAFDEKFFTEIFLNEFLNRTIDLPRIETAAYDFVLDKSGPNVDFRGSLSDNSVVLLLCVILVYYKKTNIQISLSRFFMHCIQSSKTLVSNWIPTFDDAGISTLVTSVSGVFHTPAEFHEPYLKNTYDDSNGARNMLEGYVNYVHKTTNESPQTYASYFPIVQSSGYGKTRLIRESMNTTPVYYVCLRGAGVSGSPSRSPVVSEKFTDWANTSECYAWIIMRILYHHLKCAVADDVWVAENIKSMYHRQGLLSFQTDKKVGETNECSDFWNAVFKDIKLEDLQNFARPIIRPVDLAAYSGIRDFKRLHSALHQEDFLTMHPDERQVAFTTLETLAVLISKGHDYRCSLKIPRTKQRKILPLVLAVDEVSNLLPPEIRSQRIPNQIVLKDLMKTSKFYFFRQACTIFRSTMVFTVLDTLAGLWLYAPPNKLDPSFRILEANYKVFHPFIRLPFPRSLVLPAVFQLYTDSVNDKNLELHFKFNRFDMAIQSRPLYYGYIYDRRDIIKAALKNKDPEVVKLYFNAWDFIASISYYKLIGVMFLSDMKFDLASSTPESPQYLTLISLFAARFGVIPKEEVYKQALINANAATLLNLSEDRQYADVLYVMEPIIGEAAVRVMNMPDTSDNACKIAKNCPSYKLRLFDRAFELVCREALAGTLGAITNAGYFAEVIAAVLLARAFDCSNMYPYPHYSNIEELLKAQKNGNGSQHIFSQSTSTAMECDKDGISEVRPFLSEVEPRVQMQFENSKISGAPVTVYSWLMHLLSSGSDNIPKRFPKNEIHKMPKILTGWMRILQFCQPKKKKLNRLSLAVNFTHYSAISCAKFTEGFDLIIPVYLKSYWHMQDLKEKKINSLDDILANPEIANSMSGIFVQVKAYRDCVPRDTHAGFVVELLSKARAIVPTGPICTIIMYMNRGLSHCQARKCGPPKVSSTYKLHYSTVCSTEAEILTDLLHSQYCKCHSASLASQASHQPHDPSNTQSMNIETEEFYTSQTVVPEEVNPGERQATEMEITDTEMDVVTQEQTSSDLAALNISDEEKSNIARLSELRALTAKKVAKISDINLDEIVHITCSGLSSHTYNTILSESSWEQANNVIAKDSMYPFEYRNAKEMYSTPATKMSKILQSHNPANMTTSQKGAIEATKYLSKFI